MTGFRVCTLFLLFQIREMTVSHTVISQRVREEILERFGSITTKKINGIRWKICLAWQLLWLWVCSVYLQRLWILLLVVVVQMFIPV